MFKYALVIVLAACWCAVGCGNPVAPGGANVAAMQAWAAAHALESCILMQDGTGKLVPIGQEGDAKIMPISYCNPAE